MVQVDKWWSEVGWGLEGRGSSPEVAILDCWREIGLPFPSFSSFLLLDRGMNEIIRVAREVESLSWDAGDEGFTSHFGATIGNNLGRFGPGEGVKKYLLYILFLYVSGTGHDRRRGRSVGNEV